MKLLPIDLETYSELPLRPAGHYAYARHPSTEILMAAYAVDDSPPICISLWPKKPIPSKLAEALESPEYIKIGHSAGFEFEMLSEVGGLDLDITQWRCSMVWAYYASLPGALEMACNAIQLPFDKQKDMEGKKQLTWFCKPRIPTKKLKYTRNTPDMFPERWKKFMVYCKQDVIAMMTLINRLHQMGIIVPDEEWELWFLDQKINRQGLPVDRDMILGARELASTYKERLLAEAHELTGMENPNSVSQIKEWLAEQGIHTETIDKKWVADMLKEDEEEIPF